MGAEASATLGTLDAGSTPPDPAVGRQQSLTLPPRQPTVTTSRSTPLRRILLLALLGAALLVLDYILNRVVAVSLVAGLAVVFGWLWLALPLRMHHARRSP